MLFRSMGRSEHVTAAADPASPSHSGRSDATAESATPLIPDDNDVLLPQHLNTEDVNVMKDSENADDYESIGSEADGSGSSDDDRIKRRQIGDEESSGVEMGGVSVMLRAEVAVHGSSPPALLAGDALSKGAVPAMDDGALGALVASEVD
ncbi:hypothetical protein JG687_00013484 [Phytophthora cactorum]|uniref:Uncharacterized protein n=2 Tax=Phytophthora cactorum TaxID=29920 RepID=A0A8T1TYV3_9STRA|nr:hypothetical protein JG687_00013484 [Phytophthora cactorum]